MRTKMRFVFVHGGFHAAWCWEQTIAELELLGHEGVAVDLPGHGARVDEESTLANRRDAIVSMMRPGDVLVGHSGGGFDATLAADAAPELVSHITYLAAALPREGRTYPEAMAMRDSEEGDFEADVLPTGGLGRDGPADDEAHGASTYWRCARRARSYSSRAAWTDASVATSATGTSHQLS